MLLPLSLTLGLGLIAQAKDDPESPAARLEVMKASVESFAIRAVEGDSPAFRLQVEPVLRFNNPVGESQDGAVFLWFSRGERPAVAAQVFMKRDGSWVHEFTSLSPVPIVGKAPEPPDWEPSRVGVEFKPVPGAPKPGDSPEKRLRQMQGLARDFVVEDYFRQQSWQPLRMLTRPFARYGKPGDEVSDGALFAYVLTTDPEAFLMLEARPGKDGPEWQYALAPMTTYALKASCKGQQVWELPYRRSNVAKQDQPFYVRQKAAITRRPKP